MAKSKKQPAAANHWLKIEASIEDQEVEILDRVEDMRRPDIVLQLHGLHVDALHRIATPRCWCADAEEIEHPFQRMLMGNQAFRCAIHNREITIRRALDSLMKTREERTKLLLEHPALRGIRAQLYRTYFVFESGEHFERRSIGQHQSTTLAEVVPSADKPLRGLIIQAISDRAAEHAFDRLDGESPWRTDLQHLIDQEGNLAPGWHRGDLTLDEMYRRDLAVQREQYRAHIRGLRRQELERATAALAELELPERKDDDVDWRDSIERRREELRLLDEQFPGICKLRPEYAERRRAIEQGGSVLNADLTARETEQVAEANRQKLHPTLNDIFAAYQRGRGAQSTTLYNERKRHGKHWRDTELFNTPVSKLNDAQAIKLIRSMEREGIEYHPRLETKKTLSQIGSFLRDEGHADSLLFQKIKVRRTDAESKAAGAKSNVPKFYHPREEMPSILKTARRSPEQFDAACTLYFGAFRLCDAKGVEWQGVEWEPFAITYWNSKGGRWDTKHPHRDLRPVLRARWERQGKPETGLVFKSTHTGDRWGDTYDWQLDRLVHDEAGVEKQRGRKCHAFRHAGAVAAASGAWGPKWSRDEVAKLLNDSSDAVDVYFDILDDSMHELASNTTSQLDALGLTPEVRSIEDANDIPRTSGAGEGDRTLDIDLGKVALYR